jgi:hypothetical protein
MLFFISLVIVFWVAWRSVESVRGDHSPQHGRAIGVLAVTFGLGLALSAVQLLPTAELAASAPHGQKGALSYITSFSLLPKHLFGLLSPNPEGTPAFDSYEGEQYYWEYVLYIGLIPLALAVIGATRRRRWPLAGLAAAALVLALARCNPLYDVLRFLPGFSDFRVPARYILIFTFGAALLVSFGWDAIAGLRQLHKGRRLVALGAAVAALSVFDLLWFDRTLKPLADRSVFTSSNRLVEMLRDDKEWWRAMIVPPARVTADWTPAGGWYANADGWAEVQALLPADVAQSYQIRIPDGYAGFKEPHQALFFTSAYAQAQMGDLRLLSLAGVKYLALPPQARLSGLTAIRVGPFAVFRNPGAFPRVFTVPQTLPVRDPYEAHRRTVELAHTGRLREVGVVRDDAAAISSPRGMKTEFSVSEPRPERVVISARADADGLLVLNERYDQGWIVKVDGRPAPLLTVDVVLMGVEMPKGEHRVEFLYQPRAFLTGRLLTFISLVLAAALVSIPALWRARPKAEVAGKSATSG